MIEVEKDEMMLSCQRIFVMEAGKSASQSDPCWLANLIHSSRLLTSFFSSYSSTPSMTAIYHLKSYRLGCSPLIESPRSLINTFSDAFRFST